jgi:hypothetical protein
MSDFNPVSIRSLLVVMVHLNALKINSMQQGICILAIKSSDGITASSIGRIIRSEVSVVHGHLSGLMTRGLVYSKSYCDPETKEKCLGYHLTKEGELKSGLGGITNES